MNKELNRLATFVDWRFSCGAWPSRLASHGFYATGSGDTAACFDCGLQPHWQEGDDPSHKHRQQSPNCPMVNGLRSDNVPLVPLHDDFDRNIVSNNSAYYRNIVSDSRSDRIAGPSISRDVKDSCAETTANEAMEFLRVCRSALNRARQKGLLNPEQPAQAIDPENPDFSLLRHEAARLGTFTNFPTNSPVTPAALAKAGFFYKGPIDRVQCAFCRGLLRNWVRGDDAMEEHKKHQPQCLFVRDATQCGNVLIEDDDTRRYTPTERTYTTDSHDFQDVSEVDAVTLDSQPTFSSLRFETRVPCKYPQYSSVDARRQTFRVEGATVPRGQDIDVLADAGFFHVGPNDNVKCFCCDIGLKNWRLDDNPWVEHARWFPRCSYLRQKKDTTFIENAQIGRTPSVSAADGQSTRLSHSTVTSQSDDALPASAASVNRTSVDAAGPQRPTNAAAAADVTTDNAADDDAETEMLLEENRQLHDARTCRVCMDLEVNVVFLPCGHLVCCDSCAPALRNCAVCRSLIRGTVKVFLT